MNRLPLLVLFTLVAAHPRVASAQVPQTMSYQGVLTDNLGNLVPDGNYNLTFRIFDASVAGVPLYTEVHAAVPVTRGGFSILIGDFAPLTLPFDRQYWLEIQVNADPPLVPRVRLASSPYALSLRLPFVGSTGVASPQAGIAITNTGTGQALIGTANGNLAGVSAILGTIVSPTPGTDASGVRGENNGTGSVGNGVYGVHAAGGAGVRGSSNSGIGVFGLSPTGDGARGITNSGFGVQAAALTTGTGLAAQAQSGNGILAESETGIGVWATSETFKAIYGQTNSTAPGALAIHGVVNPAAAGSGSVAVRGENNGTGSSGIGVYGSQEGSGWGVEGSAPSGRGVYGTTTSGVGVYAAAVSGDALFAASSTGTGVIGQTSSTAAAAIGVHGIILSTAPGGFSAGVKGENRGTGPFGVGVYGSHSGTGWGVYGVVPPGAGLAGKFSGNVDVSGTLTKGAGAFKIDHPLDPENKYLYHSFVESPDMKNIYDGVAILDANGEVTVGLPDWFEALNRDFRYQLTAIGAPAPGLHVAEKLEGCRFTIGGGPPGLEVSWQVTGTRRDASANAHRIPTEVAKAEADRGLYLDPVAFGQPREKGISYAQERRMSGGEKDKATAASAGGAGSANSKQAAGAPSRARAGR